MPAKAGFFCKAALGALLVVPFVHAATGRQSAIDAAIAGERMPGDRLQDAWHRPKQVLEFLDLQPGQHVLDFFAGPGYFSELLSRIVGPTGSVTIYNDALYEQAAYHDLMARLAHHRLRNAKSIEASANYLRLKPGSVDRVLIVMVYHDLYWHPAGMPDTLGDARRVLRNLYAALKPGGEVVVVDHVANSTPRERLIEVAGRLHRIDPKAVIDDFERAGFEFVAQSDALKNIDDDHTQSIFDASVRRRTDRFMYKFRKPKE